MQISRKPPQQRWGGVRESAVLTYSQVVLMLLVWGPHLRTTGSESEGGTRAAVWSSPWLFILLHFEDSFLDGV